MTVKRTVAPSRTAYRWRKERLPESLLAQPDVNLTYLVTARPTAGGMIVLLQPSSGTDSRSRIASGRSVELSALISRAELTGFTSTNRIGSMKALRADE